jgi:hypothetical protein
VIVMLACGAAVVVAAVVAWRWRSSTVELPAWAIAEKPTVGGSVRVLAWLAGVGISSGLLVGTLVVGPAGRLVMRLLAATSPEAQGRITEADQVVGRITLEGTVGFVVFVGIPFGVVVGLLHAFTCFLLPRGVLGGVLLGAGVLVVLGSTVDPLRGANPDFGIVGPGWLALLAFSALALLAGAVVAPVAGRVASAAGGPGRRWMLWMLPLDLLLVAALTPAPAALAVVALGSAVFVAAFVMTPAARRVAWHRARRALQVALAAAVAVSVPEFVSAALTIAA